jgi:hypothetical protein
MRAWLFRPLNPFASYVAIAVLAVATWVFVVVPLWRFYRSRISLSCDSEAAGAPVESTARPPLQHKSLARWLAEAVIVLLMFALGLWAGWYTASPWPYAATCTYARYVAKVRDKAILLARSRSNAGEISEGSTFGITEVQATETPDPEAEKNLMLRIGVKKQTNAQIDHNKVTIQVFFYDSVNDNDVELTDAHTSYEWLTPKHDWTDANPEILAVRYVRAKSKATTAKPENAQRRYLGYRVLAYYDGELQAFRAQPVKLLALFPPSPSPSPSTKLFDQASKAIDDWMHKNLPNQPIATPTPTLLAPRSFRLAVPTERDARSQATATPSDEIPGPTPPER